MNERKKSGRDNGELVREKHKDRLSLKGGLVRWVIKAGSGCPSGGFKALMEMLCNEL